MGLIGGLQGSLDSAWKEPMNACLPDIYIHIYTTFSHYRHCRRGREREKGIEYVLNEIMAENFPSLKRKQISRYKKHRSSQIR